MVADFHINRKAPSATDYWNINKIGIAIVEAKSLSDVGRSRICVCVAANIHK